MCIMKNMPSREKNVETQSIKGHQMESMTSVKSVCHGIYVCMLLSQSKASVAIAGSFEFSGNVNKIPISCIISKFVFISCNFAV